MGKKLTVFLILVSLFFLVVIPSSLLIGRAFAQDSPLFPGVSAGPGLFLPNSPFYILDKLFQEVKLAASLSPEKRALVRTQIIGERMAELRVMHARGDNGGVDTALSEISKEARKLSKDLREEALSGKDLSKTAKSINDSLRLNRLALFQASQNLDEELSLKLESINKTLLVAKVDVEEFLGPADLEDALQNDLNDELETAVLGVSTKAEEIQGKIDKLQIKANEAAEKETNKAKLEEQKEAKKALSKEIKEKNKKLREERKKLFEERKKKLEETREAFKKAREAFLKLKQSQKAEDELRQNTEEIEPTPTVNP